MLRGVASVEGEASLVLFFLFIAIFPRYVDNGIITNTKHFRRCLPFVRNGHIKVIIGRASIMKAKRARLLSALLGRRVGMIGMFTPRRNFHKGTSTKRAIGSNGSSHAKIDVISLCKGGGGPATTRLGSVSIVLFSVRSIKTHFCACVDAVCCMVRTYTRGGGRVVMLSQPGPYSCMRNPVLGPTCQDFINVLPVPMLRKYAVNRLTQVVGKRN